MITKQEVILLYAKAKAWKMEEKGTSGISYKAEIYADKKVTVCKVEKPLFDKIENLEVEKGTAIIEIIETDYNGKKGVQYLLKEFAWKK